MYQCWSRTLLEKVMTHPSPNFRRPAFIEPLHIGVRRSTIAPIDVVPLCPPRRPSFHICWEWFEFSALFLVLEIFYPGGSQAHRGTLLYPGLGQAQILHVGSTCKTCGGVYYIN